MALRLPALFHTPASSTILAIKAVAGVRWFLNILAFRSFQVTHHTSCTRELQAFLSFAGNMQEVWSDHSSREVEVAEGERPIGRLHLRITPCQT